MSRWSLADWTKIGKAQLGENNVIEGYDSDRQSAAIATMEAIKALADKIPAAP